MAVEVSARVEGLQDIERALEAAFPKQASKQKSVITSGMRRAAKPILASAKVRASSSDSSGALAASLGLRSRSTRGIKSAGDFSTGGVGGLEITARLQLVSIRKSKRAVSLYNQFYNRDAQDIRHAHLVEFGHVIKDRTGKVHGFRAARPFMWPAVRSGTQQYINSLARHIRDSIQAAVKRAARTRAKKK